ncbi:MAG: recombinase family protein, partial [Clostridia bacterium]|nr:recombinase family protein [Clostridia bacterium]
RHIFDLYISGMGVQKIILDLNKTANEYAPWKKDHIRYILSNEKYIGDPIQFDSYDDIVVRRLVEVIRINPDRTITVSLKGGKKIDELI